MALGSNGSVRLTRAPYVVNKITAKPFAGYLDWRQGRLARVRVTQIFPRKTCQPVTIGVICLYVRRLTSDGFGAQTRH